MPGVEDRPEPIIAGSKVQWGIEMVVKKAQRQQVMALQVAILFRMLYDLMCCSGDMHLFLRVTLDLQEAYPDRVLVA